MGTESQSSFVLILCGPPLLQADLDRMLEAQKISNGFRATAQDIVEREVALEAADMRRKRN